MKIIVLISLCLALFFIPANAQSKIVPVVEMNTGALLGGVENGKWFDAKTTVKTLEDENLYRTYQLNSGASGEAKYPKPKDEGVPCEEYYAVNEVLSDKYGVAIGKNATWNAVPRSPQPVDVNNAVYKKAVADALRTKGVVNAKIQLTRAFRIDLEGDGKEEVVIEATNYSGLLTPHAYKGTYSFILLRKIVGGSVRNIVIAGDFYKKNVEGGAPAKYELSAIADLNGDGKMEIITYGAYYEGNWVETHEMKGNKPIRVKVFDTGCGV